MNDSLKSALSVRLQAFGQYSSTRVPAGNGIKALCVFGAVALVGLMALPAADDAAVDVTIAKATALPAPAVDLTRFDMALADEFAASAQHMREVTIKSGDNLGPLLQREGMSGPDAHRFVQAFSEQFSPRRLRVGQSFNLHMDGDRITDVTFKPSAVMSWLA